MKSNLELINNFTTKLLVFSGIESYPTSRQEQAWRLGTALEPRRLCEVSLSVLLPHHLPRHVPPDAPQLNPLVLDLKSFPDNGIIGEKYEKRIFYFLKIL